MYSKGVCSCTACLLANVLHGCPVFEVCRCGGCGALSCLTAIIFFEMMKLASLAELGRTKVKVAFRAVRKLIGYDAL